MKLKKLFGGLASALVLSLGLAACGEKEHDDPVPPQTEDSEFTISFDTVGGSSVQNQTIQSGGKITKPADPKKDGYVFAGWYTAQSYSATSKWEFDTDTVSGELVLYAKWDKICTVEEILALCGDTAGYVSTSRYYVRATIKSIQNPTYGSMIISDDTGEISVYGSYGSDGEKRYSELDEKPYAGDEVLLSVIVQNFNGTKEIKSGWILEFTHNEPAINEADYEAMSVDAARTAEKGKKVKVSGVVARITYAMGMIPSGFYLVDSTNSIYVYDSQIASQVEIGNQITIAADKTYWILDTEVESAEKYGYGGCCQLEKAYILENDKQTSSEFNKSWITESTVKDIMETPVSENITTTIYKVNALVSKKAESGYTNYYFYDIDGTTGTYTYTQCNGSDFAWLDEFDGKICTVYLSAINAKSTASGCFFRLLPIAVAYENYTFDTADAAEFAVKYHGVDQFESYYMSDPALEVRTEVSSELLGFENAVLSYVSSNENVVYFTEADGKLYMHTGVSGTAQITITGTYTLNGEPVQYSETITITVESDVQIDSIGVKEAIDTALETEVTVKGIVGPSLINQVGFYLIDETGTIAVKTDNATMATLHMGDEVIIKGTRTAFKSGTTYYGQSCLLDSVVVANYYGNHEYSKDSFDSTKTLAELYALDAIEDYTAQVFVVEAVIDVAETAYSTNYSLISTDGATKLSLYSGKAAHYEWLKDYAGQTVSVELALCNWNGKTYYRGCVLSITVDGQTIYNTFNFEN